MMTTQQGQQPFPLKGLDVKQWHHQRIAEPPEVAGKELGMGGSTSCPAYQVLDKEKQSSTPWFVVPLWYHIAINVTKDVWASCALYTVIYDFIKIATK